MVCKASGVWHGAVVPPPFRTCFSWAATPATVASCRGRQEGEEAGKGWGGLRGGGRGVAMGAGAHNAKRGRRVAGAHAPRHNCLWHHAFSRYTMICHVIHPVHGPASALLSALLPPPPGPPYLPAPS